MINKKLVCIIALCMVFSVSFSAAAQRDEMQERLMKQEKSNETFQRIINYFTAENGDVIYPHYYGGAFLDEHGDLVIELTVDSAETKREIQKIAETTAISFRIVDNSRSSLQQEYDYWTRMLQTRDEQPIELIDTLNTISEVYVDENDNVIIISLKELNDKTRSIIDNCALKPKVIRIIESPEVEFCYTINPGAQITVNSSMGYSTAFRCYYYEDGASVPTYGFVTAAHNNALNQSVKLGDANGTIVGYIDRRQFGGHLDASVVALYSGHNASKTTNWSTQNLSTSYSTNLATNTILYKEGAGTTTTSGPLKSLSYTFSKDGQTFTNFIKASLTVNNGDSGGIVYTGSGTYKTIVGVVSAKLFGYAICCQAQYIVAEMGVTLY